jgi:predicted ATPase
MKIESLHIRNFRVFKDAELRHLPSMAVLVGKNGTGKSTLFDVFGFLRDALADNVHVALRRRGGFEEVRSRGATGPIRIVIKFREDDGPLVTYDLAIALEGNRAVVEREVLKYRRGQHGQPWHFLDFKRGQGEAIRNEEDYGKEDAEIDRETQQLDSPDLLAIKGLGQFQRFKVASSFRKLIEDWHLSDLHVSDARPSKEAGHAEHLSARGDNLALFAQYLYDDHPDVFKEVLQRMTERVPGVSKVEATETVDGRVVLRFQDGAFRDPFVARYVSDGTIKMFAYSSCSTIRGLTRCSASRSRRTSSTPSCSPSWPRSFGTTPVVAGRSSSPPTPRTSSTRFSSRSCSGWRSRMASRPSTGRPTRSCSRGSSLRATRWVPCGSKAC